MNPDPRQEWAIFRNALVDELKALSHQQIADAWSGTPLRTRFYRDDFFPRLALRLGLELENERFKVDHTLLKTHAMTGIDVPWVFIESENNAMSAHDEVTKLCRLFAPIKLLVICHEWTDEDDYWQSNKGAKNTLLARWLPILKAHNEVNPQSHVFGILIGECKDNNYRFYLMAYDQGAQEVEPENIILEFKWPTP